MNWIKTKDEMPKAGLNVLAFCGKVIRVHYAPRFTLESGCEDDCYEYNEDDDEYFLQEGWYECNEFEETNWHVEGEVTHWMPLPEPPKPVDSNGQAHFSF